MEHRQTKLFRALLTLAITASAPASAVTLAQDGLGQVLIYPYYTVRSVDDTSFATLLSIVNTRNEVKAVKVRVRESKAGASVLDFNLFLSPYDVWTAAVLPTTDGAKVLTQDRSCTIPPLPATGKDFVNFTYFGDPIGGSLDRTREGSLDVLEMGVVAAGSATATAITHVNGRPSCSYGLFRPITDAEVAGDVSLPPSGGLFGNATLINVAQGTDYHIPAVALGDWRDAPLYGAVGTARPDLDDVHPKRSVVRFQENGEEKVAVTGSAENWGGTNPVDAVSAVLMHQAAQEEFVLDNTIAASTDWIISFPTKRFYYSSAYVPTALFQRSLGSAGACEDVGPYVCGQADPTFDREEFRLDQACFPEPPPGTQIQLCWTSGAIAFNPSQSESSNVLGAASPARRSLPFLAGWMSLEFWPLNSRLTTTPYPQPARQLMSAVVPTVIFTPSTGNVVTNTSATYLGLPAIGFAATSYSNGLLTVPGTSQPVLANYGEARMTRNTTAVVSP
jgi:hypothetical protein